MEKRSRVRQIVVHNEDSVTSFNPVAFELNKKVWDFFRNEWGVTSQINPPPKPKDGELPDQDAVNSRIKVIFESGNWRYYTIDGRINAGARVRNLRHEDEKVVTFLAPSSTLGEKDKIIRFMIFLNQAVFTTLERMAPQLNPKYWTNWQVSLVKKLPATDVRTILNGFDALKEKIKGISPKDLSSMKDSDFNPFTYITIKNNTKDIECISALETEHSRILAYLEDNMGINISTMLFQNIGKAGLIRALELMTAPVTASEIKTEVEEKEYMAKIISKPLRKLGEDSVLAQLKADILNAVEVTLEDDDPEEGDVVITVATQGAQI